MRGRRLVVLSLVTAMSITAGMGIWSYIRSIAREGFENDTIKVKQSFYEGVKAAESAVQSFQSFGEALPSADQARFGRFASDLMSKLPFLTGVAYYERVPQSLRATYEETLRASGLGETILDGGQPSQPEIVPASVREEYYPITCVDALAREASYFGWDALADPSKAIAIRRAVSGAGAVATGSFLLDNGNVALEVFASVRGTEGAKGVIGATIDLTKLLGDERWRKGVTIIMAAVLEGERTSKDIYRHLDAEPTRWPHLGTLKSQIEIERFGQRLGLRFAKDLFPGRINLALVWLALAGCGILTLLAFYLVITYERLEDSLRKLAESNANLERKVEERTRALIHAHAEIKEILDNLDDLVITVDPKQTIGAIYSAASTRLLGLEQIAGCHLSQVLFKDLDPHDEKASRHLFALRSLASFNDFQWSISSHDLLKVIHYQVDPTEAPRVLSLRYSPIFEADTLRKMIVVAADVTELLALRANVAQREKAASLRDSILAELAAGEKGAMRGFFEEMDLRVRAMENLVANPSPAQRSEALRTLHTLKGSARTVGLRALARKVHATEDALAEGATGAHADESTGPTNGRAGVGEEVGLATVIAVYSEYHRIFTELFASAAPSMLGEAMFGRIADFLDSGTTERLILAQWLRAMQAAEITSVVDLFMSFRVAIQDMAGPLNKDVALEAPSWDVYVDHSLRAALREAFTHGLRNALDHGLEEVTERAAAGKERQGRLWLTYEEQGDQIVVTICDDGRGVNTRKVYDLAVQRGLTQKLREAMLEEEILELLFAPGFSTKDVVTDISGRGIGLDAVRAALTKHGIACQIRSVPGQGSLFEFSLPVHHVHYAVEAATGLRALPSAR